MNTKLPINWWKCARQWLGSTKFLYHFCVQFNLSTRWTLVNLQRRDYVSEPRKQMCSLLSIVWMAKLENLLSQPIFFADA